MSRSGLSLAGSAWCRHRRVAGSARSARAGRVVTGEIGSGKRLGHELRDAPAVGPTAGTRRQPAHDLAQVAGAARAGRGDGLADEGLDRRVIELLGEVVAE